jgi:hypothetical protein
MKKKLFLTILISTISTIVVVVGILYYIDYSLKAKKITSTAPLYTYQSDNDKAKETGKDTIVYRPDLTSLEASYNNLYTSIRSTKKDNSKVKQELLKEIMSKKHLFLNKQDPGNSAKIDSLRNAINELAQRIDGLKPVAVAVPYQEKQVQQQDYYKDIYILYKSRKGDIYASVNSKMMNNFRYGQVFRFNEDVPAYLKNFTDKNGRKIENSEVKTKLIGKNFWVESIELSENKVIINCYSRS